LGFNGWFWEAWNFSLFSLFVFLFVCTCILLGTGFNFVFDFGIGVLRLFQSTFILKCIKIIFLF
jgi:hypothetical protein